MQLTHTSARNGNQVRGFSFGALLATMLIFGLIIFALVFSPTARWRLHETTQQSNESQPLAAQPVDKHGS